MNKSFKSKPPMHWCACNGALAMKISVTHFTGLISLIINNASSLLFLVELMILEVAGIDRFDDEIDSLLRCSRQFADKLFVFRNLSKRDNLPGRVLPCRY